LNSTDNNAFESKNAALIGAAFLLVSCGGDRDSSESGKNDDNGNDMGLAADHAAKPVETRMSETEIAGALAYEFPAAKEYFAAHADFFRSASASDLPADLQWENGEEQEEFASPEAIKFGIERIYIPDFPGTLRTVGPDSSTSFRGYIHDEHELPLVKKHPETGAYYGALAREWAISEDRKTVYFRIDPKARFSDGVPVQVKHFWFTIYFMRSDWIQAPWYKNWYSDKYTHLTKYDDLTFSVGLTDAKPDTLRFFEEDLFPLPEHFYDEFDETFINKYAWRFQPTTGPYVILEEDLRKGRTITQTRQVEWWADDKKFWRNRYNPIKRHFSVIRDPDKAVESLIAGEFDSIRVSTPDVWDDKLGASEAVKKGWLIRAQFYNEVPRPCYSLRLNKTQALLGNRDIREGIQYATNFDLAIEQVFRGQYARMQSSSDGYGEFTNPDIHSRSFDAKKARELFAKAGFVEMGSDGILQNDKGQRLSFTITTGYKRLSDVLTVVQQSARQAGIEYKLEITDPTTAWKKVQQKKHEIVLAALNRSVEKYPRYHDFWHSYNAFKEDGSVKTETNNWTMTADPDWDTLIDRYERSTSYEEIKAIAYELEEKIHADAAFVPGWVRPFFQAAYWDYIRWPEGFSKRLVREYDDLCTQWIDPEAKEKIINARREKADLGGEIIIFDQHKP